jgi:3-hydroxyisobutyrate dehydrogenase-like beta-hydroxyacid dehydrogenase
MAYRIGWIGLGRMGEGKFSRVWKIPHNTIVWRGDSKPLRNHRDGGEGRYSSQCFSHQYL